MSKQITILSEREKVRNKISVWLESSKNHIHTVKELVGNSNDLIISGIGDNIYLELSEDCRKVIIQDNCTGLPVEGSTEDGTNNYIALFETLFASTKYDQDSYTVGTNGIFLCVLTYSSEYVKYTIGRPDGNIYEIEYNKGVRDYDLKIVGKTDKTFTRIEYILDSEVYDNPIFDFDEICSICKAQSAISDVTITCKQGENINVFRYENGIEDYLKDCMKDKPIVDMIRLTKDVSYYVEKKDRNDELKIDLAFTFTNSNEHDTHIELLNGSILDLHGTPFDGVVLGFKNAINKYLKNNNLYKNKEKQISNDDVLMSLRHALDLKSLLTEFTNQTKRSSLAGHYKIVIQSAIEEFMEVYFIENKIEGEKICQQVLLNKRISERSEKARLNLKKKLSEEITIFNKPQGLLDCKSKDTTINRLFIAEGQSAKSGLAMGRNKDTDAIYGIRGKILSCLKADESKIFSNDTVINIIRILGCGVELKSSKNKEFCMFDINKLKYGKIIFGTDNDVDGLNIRCLLLTMFYRLMPTLIKEGRIYYAESPLFEITDVKTGTTYYAVDEKEKNEILSSLKGKKVEISRNKGIGELDKEVTKDTIMNPSYEGLYQITMEDAEKANEYFELFMGSSVAPRREYIINHFDEYCNESL